MYGPRHSENTPGRLNIPLGIFLVSGNILARVEILKLGEGFQVSDSDSYGKDVYQNYCFSTFFLFSIIQRSKTSLFDRNGAGLNKLY